MKGPLLNWAGMAQTPFASPDLFTDVKELKEQNRILQDQINQDELNNTITNFIFEENARLKGYFLKTNQQIQFAAIAKKPPVSAYGSIIIDQGRLDGVEIGDGIFAYDFVALGDVHLVSDHAAKVDLYARADRETQVSVNGISAVAVGYGAGVYKVSLPKGAEVSVGDVVRLPLLRLSMLGTVSVIDNDPQDPEITLTVISPINIHALDYVEIRDGLENTVLLNPENNGEQQFNESDD